MYIHEQTAKWPKRTRKNNAQMNGSTNYTVSCQSSRWKLERDDIKTLFDNKLIARMNRVNEVQKINVGVTTRVFAIDFKGR